MKIIKSSLILFVFASYCFLSVNAQEISDASSREKLSDEQIIKLLASQDKEKSEEVSKEIFSRGEKIIPQLLLLKNDERCFYGLSALGRWGSGVVRGNPPCEGSDRVTVEIAALFLIAAIYEESLQFAEPPYLCEKNCLDGGNTDKSVKRAWKATQKWNSIRQKKGIVYLRETTYDPLKFSGLSW